MKRDLPESLPRLRRLRYAVWLGIVSASAVFTILPLRAEEVTIQHNGLTLNANLVLAEGKPVSDGVILLAHGLLQHNRMEIIRVLQGLFHERGYSTLAMTFSASLDNRRGPYDCATPHRYTTEGHVDEIGLWLAWLKGRGARKIILAGHSGGGNLMARFVVERNEPVIAKVILFGAGTGGFEGWTPETYWARYRVKLPEARNRAQVLIDAGKGDTMMENVDFLFCPKAEVSANTFMSYYRPKAMIRPSLARHLENLPKPSLVIAASEDNIAPDLTLLVKRYVDGKRLRLIVIEGCGHFFRDLCADDAVDAAVAFLEE